MSKSAEFNFRVSSKEDTNNQKEQKKIKKKKKSPHHYVKLTLFVLLLPWIVFTRIKR